MPDSDLTTADGKTVQAATFKDYATGTAFAISLSKPQIDCLCQIEQRGGSWLLLTTSHALQRKGLIVREFEFDPGGNAKGKWRMRLTEAGAAVIPLLKLAGLWTEYEPPPQPIPIPEVKVKIRIDED